MEDAVRRDGLAVLDAQLLPAHDSVRPAQREPVPAAVPQGRTRVQVQPILIIYYFITTLLLSLLYARDITIIYAIVYAIDYMMNTNYDMMV